MASFHRTVRVAGNGAFTVFCYVTTAVEYDGYLEDKRKARSPAAGLKDSTGVPIFFASVPLKKPRTECACQPVAFMSAFSVTPPGRFNRSRILAFLVPRRRGEGFLAWMAVRAALALVGAAWGRRLATRAFVFAPAGAFLFPLRNRGSHLSLFSLSGCRRVTFIAL